jgi:putative DNA primase/helicase
MNELGSIEYWYEKKNNKGEIVDSGWKWLSHYLMVTHFARDKDNGQWLRIASLADRDGIKKEIKITAALISGDGNALKELLEGFGLALNNEATGKLKSYLAQSNPSARRRTVDKMGWYKDVYVFPHKVYGHTGNEEIALQMGKVLPLYRCKGTLLEWQNAIGKYAEGNSRLQGGILMALVGSVLTPIDHEGFGLHYLGASSVGKSTASHVACSIYGSELKTYRTTDNSAEALGLLSNDNILIIDEISQVGADAFYEMVYMLFNGQGKARMTRGAEARPISTFRLALFSNGEISGEAKVKESRVNRHYKAGQAIRMMDVPADVGHGFGIFDTIFTFEDSASFTKHLREASQLYCGSVGEAWLTLLTEHKKEVLNKIKQVAFAFEQKPLESKGDNQVGRAKNHFGLMAGVGEVAIEAGILNWEQGSAIKACEVLFNAWLNQRGGLESHEVITFVKEVTTFLHEQGSNRFEPVIEDDTDGMPITTKTRDRMGFSKMVDKIIEYYAFPSAFDKELIKGGDKKTLLSALVEKGILEREEKHFAKLKRISGMKPTRFYVLKLPQDS